MTPAEYQQYIRNLNDGEREIVMFNRMWCKKAVHCFMKRRHNTAMQNFPQWTRRNQQIPLHKPNLQRCQLFLQTFEQQHIWTNKNQG